MRSVHIGPSRIKLLHSHTWSLVGLWVIFTTSSTASVFLSVLLFIYFLLPDCPSDQGRAGKPNHHPRVEMLGVGVPSLASTLLFSVQFPFHQTNLFHFQWLIWTKRSHAGIWLTCIPPVYATLPMCAGRCGLPLPPCVCVGSPGS